MPSIQDYKVTDTTGYKVQDIPGDSLNGTVSENKKVFDKLAELIISNFNDALDYLHSMGIDSGASNTPLAAYPVGSIYMSVNSTSPTTLFGGTWVRLKDKFLLAAGDIYTAGNTGGSADAIVPTHTHTVASQSVSATTSSEGSHTHSVSGTAQSAGAHIHGMGNLWSSGSGSSEAYKLDTNRTVMTRNTSSAGAHTHSVTGSTSQIGDHTHTVSITIPSATTSSQGESGTGKNMPPYLVVYMWKRTA